MILNPSMVCWYQLRLAPLPALCSVMLGDWNRPQRGYFHHRNCQVPRTKGIFFPGRWLTVHRGIHNTMPAMFLKNVSQSIKTTRQYIKMLTILTHTLPCASESRWVESSSERSMQFSRPESCNGQPFSSPGDLPNPGIKPRSPTLQAHSLPSEP